MRDFSVSVGHFCPTVMSGPVSLVGIHQYQYSINEDGDYEHLAFKF